MTDSTDWPYKASVVVCTYRREKVLCETLQQLLDQQTGDYEIIIVDQTEAHEPETRQTLDEMSQRDFVTYVFQTPPGLPAARNRGVELARSELVIFCDDDVILCDDYVANYRRIFADFPEVAAVAGQVLNRGETPTDAPGTFYHNGIVAEFSMLYGANFGVRKSAWQTVGGVARFAGSPCLHRGSNHGFETLKPRFQNPLRCFRFSRSPGRSDGRLSDYRSNTIDGGVGKVLLQALLFTPIF